MVMGVFRNFYLTFFYSLYSMMDDSTTGANLDQLSLKLDDSEELNALTLTTLLNSGVEEALSNLSPAQLIQLEKNVQKLKRQKSSTLSATPGGRNSLISPKSGGSGRKRRISDLAGTGDDGSGETGDDMGSVRPRPSGGQYMNLPASTPQVEYRDSTEYLHFTYSTKGHIQEYVIRVDIDDLTLEEIPEDFRNDNCVYPRALVPRENYIGNRWEYETSVNDLAWKLTWRNPGVLCGKRGLIQRAVDSYRNRTPENRSRRVMRQEKIHATGSGGSLAGRRRLGGSASLSSSGSLGMLTGSGSGLDEEAAAAAVALHVPGPKTLTIQQAGKDGEQLKVKIRVDVEGVDISQLDSDFRQNNAVYPQALLDPSSYAGGAEGRWEYENACNELAWKLAWLNAQKLAGKRILLQKAVDAYQSRIEAAERARRAIIRHNAAVANGTASDLLTDAQHHQMMLMDKAAGGDFSQMVAQTLQQALSHHEHGGLLNDDLHLHHEMDESDEDDDDEDHPQIVSTAELMGGLLH